MIGDIIRGKMKDLGLRSIREAAGKCELTSTTLWNLVTGRTKNPSIDTLQKVVKGLRFSSIEELTKEPEPTYPHVEMIMKDPTARASFEKMMVKWSQLPEEAKKSVDEYIAFVLEQNKKK